MRLTIPKHAQDEKLFAGLYALSAATGVDMNVFRKMIRFVRGKPPSCGVSKIYFHEASRALIALGIEHDTEESRNNPSLRKWFEIKNPNSLYVVRVNKHWVATHGEKQIESKTQLIQDLDQCPVLRRKVEAWIKIY